MMGSGDFAGATRLMDQAMATQILDAADPRVQQTLRDIREKQERQQREKEQAAERERERQRQRAEEEERKRQQAAAAAEKKQDGKAGKKKGKGEGDAAPVRAGGSGAVVEPSVPATGGSRTPGPSVPLETVPMEAASATMIASGAMAPVAEPALGRAASFEATMIEVQAPPEVKRAPAPAVPAAVAPPAPPKKARVARAEMEAEPRATAAVESAATPIWKQPIPLAVGGVVLVAVLGGGIYFATRSSAPVQPSGGAPAMAENTSIAPSGGVANSSASTPAPAAQPKTVAPVLPTPNQQTQREQQQAKQSSQPLTPTPQALTPQRPAAQPVNQPPISQPTPAPAPQQQVAAQPAPSPFQPAPAPAPVAAATPAPAPRAAA